MRETPDIRIFIACHKPTYVPENPLLYPVQVGSALAKSHFEGMQRDDEGDNISVKNPEYCELTAQYWAWKNVSCDYYGFSITGAIWHLTESVRLTSRDI